MLTISQVADIAGVSVATISRVLNDSPLVTEDTKKRVRKIIAELDYHPNVVARSLRSSRSRLLLALVPNIANPFHAEIVHGINKVVHAKDYNLLLCETQGFREREDAFFSMLKQKIVDGLIALDPAVSADNLTEYAPAYPIVLCYPNLAPVDVPSVAIDDELGAYTIVSHLIATGCRRIALVNADRSYSFAWLRRAGYLRALEERGLPADPGLILEYRFGVDSGFELARRVLALDERPDAVFFDYDMIAIDGQRAFIDAGLRVPQDISVVGFDGIDMTTICTPALTTIAQPAALIGSRAAEMLFSLMDGREPEKRRVVLDFELIVRESTR